MIKILENIIPLKPLKNKKGTALVMSYFVLMSLVALTTVASLSNISEMKQASNYRDAAQSFWAAEAGINRFIQDTHLLDGGSQTITIGSVSVNLSKDDSDLSERVVDAVATINGVRRDIQVEFPANPPSVFDNTMSSGDDVSLTGRFAGMNVDGKTRLSGSYQNNGLFTGDAFEDKVEGVDPTLTTMTYPDSDGNGTADEFADFVEYNRALTDPTHPDFGKYAESEVEYIPTNGTVLIYPSTTNLGKKVIFVQGDTPGQGNVDIIFDSTWASDQNVTIIATGDINYIQPLQNPSANSQLNTISYDDYNEGAVLLSAHSGVTYAHDDANFGSILSLSVTEGSLIANDDISLALIAVWKEFNYDNAVDANGLLPPGFQGLISGGSSGYSSNPSGWKEL